MELIINIHIPHYSISDAFFDTTILDEMLCFLKILRTIPTIKVSLFNNKRFIEDFKSLENSILETDLSIILLNLNSRLRNEPNILETKIFIVSLFEINPTQKLLFLKEAINKYMFKIFLFSHFKKGLCLLGPVFKPIFYEYLSVFTDPVFDDGVTYYPVKCKCHGNEIIEGYICPVCLTPYCKKRGICSVCKIKVKA